MTAPHVIEIWDIADLVPYEKNAKKHPEEQIEKLSTAIRKFGWTQPIVVWKDGSIIAGHGRRLAALKLGLAKVPVIVRRDLSKAEADALRLADNRVTSNDYDQAQLQAELQMLFDTGIELADLGFDKKEIEFVISDLGDMDESLFVSDLNEAVEQQKSENENAIGTTDDSAAPVGDALGFKRVTIAQSRTLRTIMGEVETRSGKKGAEALIDFLEEALGD